MQHNSLPVDISEQPAPIIPLAIVEYGPSEMEQELSAAVIVARFEQQGWVDETPRLQTQMLDSSRSNIIRYVVSDQSMKGRDPGPGDEIVSVTEQSGLQQLDAFFADRADEELITDEGDLSALAADMRQNLNFVGEKEAIKGLAGVKALWQSYLDADPQLQLCVPALISRQAGKKKSDEFMLEQILDLFTPEEQERYKGRIIVDPLELTAPPEHAKIILFDDYIISGEQMRHVVPVLLYNLSQKGYDYAACLEVNALMASAEHIQHGLRAEVNELDESTIVLPVRAYYKARAITAKLASGEYIGSPMTSALSSGDFGYELYIQKMVRAAREQGKAPQLHMPPLTNIVREYRQSGSTRFTAPLPRDSEPELWDDLYE